MGIRYEKEGFPTTAVREIRALRKLHHENAWHLVFGEFSVELELLGGFQKPHGVSLPGYMEILTPANCFDHV